MSRALQLCVIAAIASLSSPCEAQLVINEVYTGLTDWCEIGNLGTTPVNISGFTLQMTDDPSTNTLFTFPPGTTLAAHSVLVVTELANSPAVPAGVQRLVCNAINWSGFGSLTLPSGTCSLGNASGAGIDLVRFGAPTTNPTHSPPAPFPTALAIGDVYRRISIVDTNTPADWQSTTLAGNSPGEWNPGQPLGRIRITIANLSPGATVDVTTDPMVPFGEIYNLFSTATATPSGSGALFGVGIDAFNQILTPLSASNPLHTNLDGNGAWNLTLLSPLPPGLHLECVSILVVGGAVSAHSPVSIITF